MIRPLERIRKGVAWLSCGRRFTAIAMALLVVHYAVTWGAFQGKAAGDGWFAFLYLKAIVYHQSLDMKLVAPEYLRYFGEMGPGHHMPNRCPIGPVFVWLPFYLLVAVPEMILRAVHVIPARLPFGQSPVHVWVAGLGTLSSVLLGWRQLVVLYTRHVGERAAELAAALTVWATPMLWYTSHHPFYQHGVAFLVVAVLVEHWDRTRGQADARRFLYLGLLGGFGMSVRAQEVVWLAPIGVEIAWRVLRGPARGRWIVGGLVLGLAALVALSPQLLVWYYYSGRFAPVQAEPLRLHDPFFLVALFSTRAGVFPWTPAAYAATLGLGLLAVDALRRRAAAATATLGAALGLAFLLDLVIVACAWMVTSGFAYGSRRLSDCSIVLGLGVGVLLARWADRRRLRRALYAFLAFCVAFNFALVELLRLRKMSSPGSNTRSLAQVLEYDVHAPAGLVRAAEAVGYPFVQPAGWIWSAVHHVRPSVFETVVGTFILDRDGQWLTVLTRSLELTRKNRDYVASGMRWASEAAPAELVGEARLLLPMFAKEVVDLTLVGAAPDGPVTVVWNGLALPVDRAHGAMHVTVPRDVVDAGTNEVLLRAPPGTTLSRLDFGSRGGWW